MRTQSGTWIEDGIEYNRYPPPVALVKAMKRCWAKKLLSRGAMRFGSLASYRRRETPVLGDPNDGEGMFRMAGHPYNIGSGNPVYAWCSSLDTVTPDRIRCLAKDGGYDCVVRVHNPLLLIKRVFSATSGCCLSWCAPRKLVQAL